MSGDEKIFIPYNEETKHIYETFAKVAWEIAERRAREREALANESLGKPVVTG